jgi:hypothetical protein
MARVPKTPGSSNQQIRERVWPKSREVIARDLGTLPTDVRAKLVRENVAKLYNIPVPTPVQ